MITIVKAPVLNSVLLDANNTEITITSSNGAGHYFRALISVDNVLFDTQGWSRKDAFTSTKDLVKLYNAYFVSAFAAFTANGLVEKTNLKKKVSIVINEHLLSTDAIVQTVTLPDFYIMYNAKPVVFDDNLKIQVLGISPAVVQIPTNGKIRIPFLVKSVAEAVIVITKDNFGDIINTQTIAASTAKKIYQYDFDLSGVALAANTTYFETTITCGSTTITLRYRLMLLPDFPVKELYFKNNFGYFIPAYFDGELETVNGFKIDDYQQADGSSVIFEIQEDVQYTINTGSLLSDERAIVTQVANAYEIYFKINNAWTKIQTSTKKELEFRDKKHNYSQDLTFTFSKSGKVQNI